MQDVQRYIKLYMKITIIMAIILRLFHIYSSSHSLCAYIRWQYSSFSVAERDCLWRKLSNLLKWANMETASWPHPPYTSTTRRMQDHHPLSLQGPSFFKCLSLSPFSDVAPGIMLASRILSELSGLMTLRSKTKANKKQIKTN